jgi:hypothetical protein
MTVNAVIYNTEGLIVRSFSGPANTLTKQAWEDEAVLIGEGNGRYQYVHQGEILDRPIMPIAMDKVSLVADGVDSITVTGVPVGALVTFGDLQATAEDSTITLMTDFRENTEFSIELFPYQPFRMTVHVA